MGTFTTGCLIENHLDPSQRARIPRIMVDSGSEATWIPRGVLESIGVRTSKRDSYRMANGELIHRDVGYAIVRVGKHETIDEVVFAEKGDFILLGARALEGLNLLVDARNKKLIPGGPLPVAKSIVPGKIPPDKDAESSSLVVMGKEKFPRVTGREGKRRSRK